MLTRSHLETIRVFTCHNAFISGGSIGQTRTLGRKVRKVRKVRKSYAEVMQKAQKQMQTQYFSDFTLRFSRKLCVLCVQQFNPIFDLGNCLKIHEKALCGSNYKGQALFKK